MSSRLTETEGRVMRLAAAGFKTEEIAKALALSRETVAWHLTRSYRKLGVGPRAEVGGGSAPGCNAEEVR
jgi:LuxR family maltose regulon positive regulatory protein